MLDCWAPHQIKSRVPPLHPSAQSLASSLETLMLDDQIRGARQEGRLGHVDQIRGARSNQGRLDEVDPHEHMEDFLMDHPSHGNEFLLDGRVYSESGHYLSLDQCGGSYSDDDEQDERLQCKFTCGDLTTDGFHNSTTNYSNTSSNHNNTHSDTDSSSSIGSHFELVNDTDVDSSPYSSPSTSESIKDLREALFALKIQNAELTSSLTQEKKRCELKEISLVEERRKLQEERKTRQEYEKAYQKDQKYISRLEESIQELKKSRLVIDPKIYRQIAETYIASCKTPIRRTCSSGVFRGASYSGDVVCDAHSSAQGSSEVSNKLNYSNENVSTYGNGDCGDVTLTDDVSESWTSSSASENVRRRDVNRLCPDDRTLSGLTSSCNVSINNMGTSPFTSPNGSPFPSSSPHFRSSLDGQLDSIKNDHLGFTPSDFGFGASNL